MQCKAAIAYAKRNLSGLRWRMSGSMSEKISLPDNDLVVGINDLTANIGNVGFHAGSTTCRLSTSGV